MTYVTVDMTGAARGHYETREELLRALDRLQSRDPELIGDLVVFTYTPEGEVDGEPVDAGHLVALRLDDAPFVLVGSFSDSRDEEAGALSASTPTYAAA